MKALTLLTAYTTAGPMNFYFEDPEEARRLYDIIEPCNERNTDETIVKFPHSGGMSSIATRHIYAATLHAN